MKILIIEDEPKAVKRLTNLLLNIDPNFDVLPAIDSIQGAVSFFKNKENSFDLVLLDIQLSDGICFDIFKEVSILQPIIFTTAFDNYAIKAFEVNAIAYLLKPIKADKLELAIEKFNHWFSLHQKATNEISFPKFLVRNRSQMLLVDASEISHFYTLHKMVFMVTQMDQKYHIDYSLQQLEELLPPNHFFRVNRQSIIHKELVDKMEIVSKSRIKITMKSQPPFETIVSSEKSPFFRKWLKDLGYR